jgi:signal transduction histidine kinase
MKERSRASRLLHNSHFRLVLWYTAILALVSALLGVFIYGNQMRDINGEARFRLNEKMDGIERSLELGLPLGLQGSEFFAHFDKEGKLLRVEGISEAEARGLARPEAPDGDKRGGERHGGGLIRIEELRGAQVLVGYRILGGGPQAREGDKAESFLLGLPLDPYGMRRRLLLTLLAGISLMLAAAALGGWWLASRAMKPVVRITRIARSIGESDLSRRINLGAKDELGELADTFDAMLARLEAAFERQKRFVGDAGHELRTPLAVIGLEAERALGSRRTAAEYRRALETIQGECAYMTALVNDLLTLARSDSGEGRDREELVDLGEVALGAMERLAPLAARRGVLLRSGELPETPVRGNRVGLERMIGNLVENAIKYSRGAGDRVELGLSSSGGRAILQVSDEGRGIPPEKLPRIFDRFYRVDEARTEAADADGAVIGATNDAVPGGSGLGLSIVKAIAEAHGGSVSAESEPGRGSTFRVSLPLAEA